MINNGGFGYSLTRITILNYCERKYYFSYYGNFLKELDEGFWLQHLVEKNLKSIEMWYGEIIHNILSEMFSSIKKGENTNTKIIINKYIEEMDYFFEISKTKNYEIYDKDNKFCLSEHYYGSNIDNKFELYKNNLVLYIEQFIKTAFFTEIKEHLTDKTFLTYIEPTNKDFDSMKFCMSNTGIFEDVEIFAQPDYGVVKNEIYQIYDWKTGKIPEYHSSFISNQLQIYALKTSELLKKKDISSHKIYGYEYFIKENQIYGGIISKESINDIKNKIIKGIQNQLQYIVNGNYTQNIPKDILLFKRTSSKGKCQSCKFRKLCYDIEKIE